jgi:hypothetical protein
MSALINYNPDLIQRKIGVRESFEIKCTLTQLLINSNKTQADNFYHTIKLG